MNKPLSVRDVLTQDHYVIPIFQRNFAWSVQEISQLISDIYQYEGDYYLGTLIVYIENDRKYVIDGQQRLTVLNLIYAVLNREGHDFTSNLTFESRPECGTYLKGLLSNYSGTKANDDVDASVCAMKNGVEIIENYLSNSGIKKFSVAEFAKRFYDRTFIFCAELPIGTDLNHYFEIMNSRGEQLEQHETVKALLMKKVDLKYHEEVNKVWSACSVMDSHVLQVLKDSKYNDFKFSKQEDTSVCSTSQAPTMAAIIDGKHVNEGNSSNNRDEDLACEKCRSIIDFPNFLLLALSLYVDDVVLDDKKLLSQFQKATTIDADDFIEHLLRCRILFDKYVIKQANENEEKWRWEIMTYDIPSGKFKSTFSEEAKRQQIRMLQSMLQVSFPNNSYKKWLLALMKAIVELREESDTDLVGCRIIKHLTEYSRKYSEEVREYDMGTKTNRFIFNYLDYLLWQKYYDQVRGQNSDDGMDETCNQIFKNKKSFDEFRFTTRSSIEHLWPQSLRTEIENENFSVDSFGNLCLVSSERNSLYKNKRPLAKKEDFSFRSKESLKQVLMFSVIENANDWNAEVIDKHRRQMIEIIKRVRIEDK